MIARLEAWIFAAGSARRLAALRIGLCATLGLRLTRSLYTDLSDQPAALFRPLSFMNFFDRMPPRPLVLAVQIAGVAAAVLAAAGVRSRATLPLAWVAGVFLNGMATSIGKVVHNDVMLLLAMVPLLAAPASDAWAWDARRSKTRPADSTRYGWPLRTAMVVVAGAYFFSGFQKIVNAGPGWVTGSNMRWVMYASSDGRAAPNMWALMLADRAWLSHVVAGFTLLVETAFPIVLWRPRLTWLFVPAVVGMHIGILLAMGLDYSAQIATVLIVFVNWPSLTDRWRARRATTRRATVPA